MVREAPRERQLALVRAHPELAGREAQAGELTEASAGEQASAGLDRLTAQEIERWRALNRAYRERFDFPLVVCVREHTKASIMGWAEERLAHGADEELAVALDEIAKIARLRLEELDA
jgi:2-oxo-4-hydroxy-4-carboxy-5-ureidoimidazoline decarboxylase